MTARVSAIPWVISINEPEQGRSDGPASPRPPDGSGTAETAAAPDRWTIKRLLEWTSRFFADHGFDQPRLDAEVLLAEALGCPRIFLYTRFDEEPGEEIRARFRDWVARHARGEPVAYLVGHREFFSLRFRVDPNVLIPRPETEHVVTEAIDFLRSRQQSAPDAALQVADLGTGSGNIAIAIVRHVPKCVITATDISPAALEVARTNAREHGVEERIRFVESDFLELVDEPDRFDLIASNPPYIGTSESGTLQASVVQYEPHTALFSGPDGLDATRRLIETAIHRLRPRGRLVLETSPIIVDRVAEWIRARPELIDLRIVRDLAGLPRVVCVDRA
jgi:release factor glutamine methyltransferase